jgi:Fe-S-cluster containining protein
VCLRSRDTSAQKLVFPDHTKNEGVQQIPGQAWNQRKSAVRAWRKPWRSPTALSQAVPATRPSADDALRPAALRASTENEASRRRTLDVLQGKEHLRFQCTSCGACCRSLRVVITHHDLTRLVAALGIEAEELVEFLAPDAVDMSGEPETFVELGSGRRLMVLAQRDGACKLLGDDNRCHAYAARPDDCRQFPFDVADVPDGAGLALSLLPLEGCDYERSASVDLDARAREIVTGDDDRFRALAEYQALVARWNRLAARRRRFGHRVGDVADFLGYLRRPA